MSRDDSPLIVGDYWLDKRRDGASPDIWQIATYSGKSRSVVYKSTKQRTVERAGEFLRSYEANQRSTAKGQDASHAELLPHLFNYLREHGPDVGRLDTVKSSFRAWIGFFQQDELGTGVKVGDITKSVVARFRRWRMGPHSWSVEWDEKIYNHSHKGVGGLAVQRNIDDLKAALNHADDEKRITAPKVPSVDKKLRETPEKDPPTVKELGALFGYARDDKGVYQELCLMLGTSCRPGVALAFDPEKQRENGLIDLQPDGRPLTDKRNAIVPEIEPLGPILDAWSGEPVKSRKTWWRTARRALGTSIEAYDIRHAVSTMLDDSGVPGAQISGIVGHIPESRKVARTTGKHYLHYNPRNAPQAKRALTKFYNKVMAAADLWAADHLRTIPEYKKPIQVVNRLDKSAEIKEKRLVGADGLEPPTLSV